jgi:hypothetical protein
MVKTLYLKGAYNPDLANLLFQELRWSLDWYEGIKTRGGKHTRKAYHVDPTSHLFFMLHELCQGILRKSIDDKYTIQYFYLNLYQDGDDYTPNHSHPSTQQLVISLGGNRTLKVGKKDYVMENGDAILFGSGIHGVPKEPGASPRISIATFMNKI